MITKTYGAVGLLDYQAEIPVGRAKMVVNFSGGAITGYGIAPAEHTTSDPLVQSVIENSAAFKRGRIILMRTTGQQEAATGAQPAATAQDNAQKKTVEVSCIDDAKAWLMQTFGIAARDLRSTKQITDAAAARGITFTGI